MAPVKVLDKDHSKGEILPIFAEPGLATEEYLLEIGHAKRFLERMTSDPKFRELLAQDPQAAADKYEIPVNAEELRPLWDEAEATSGKALTEYSLTVQRYRAWCKEKFAYRDIVRTESIPSDPRYKQWRARQVRRCASELGPAKAHGLIHAPCCFELNKGCSVGCWFCGVAAPKLGDILEYTPENKAFWRGCLEVVKSVIGPAARRGFCYWATDPLDNPNYEDFCVDFADVLGKFPQTTTAIPHRDPERTRRLIALSKKHGCELNRFSVLTLGIFEKIFKAFTPEELVYVELIPQNKESTDRYAVAGRALEKIKKKPTLREGYGISIPEDSSFEEQSYNSTIACVSGFLFNMVERSVKLISPTNADEKWPLGYRIYEEGRFDSPESLRELMEGMISRHMRSTLRSSDPLKYRRKLQFEATEEGFKVRSPFLVQTFNNRAYEPMSELGQEIWNGEWTAGELALAMEKRHSVPLTSTFAVLNRMFSLGILDDEPGEA